jgi:hypothetical protein
LKIAGYFQHGRFFCRNTTSRLPTPAAPKKNRCAGHSGFAVGFAVGFSGRLAAAQGPNARFSSRFV